MSPESEIFYAIQAAVWAGWSPERIRKEVAGCYETVMEEEIKRGKQVLSAK